MYSNNINGSGAASARGFMVLFAIMLAMGFASMASPAAAAPFAYVTHGAGTVSVIDTATNPPSVVATVPVGGGSGGSPTGSPSPRMGNTPMSRIKPFR
jgi:YVTN family beta-propeller protein